MRRILALSVAGLILAAGSAFAFDDCSCTCVGGGQQYQSQQQMRRADAGSRDGYFLKNGKVVVFRNGASTELTQDATFDNGMRLQADGTIVYTDGTRTQLRDSQMLAMDGNFFDRERVNAGFRETRGRDGYFVGRNGKVMSFKDGRISEITSDITFDSGARLSVDGTLTLKDGTRSRLENSQWMSFSGEMSDKAKSEATPQNATTDRFNDAERRNQNANQNNANNNNNANAANRNQPAQPEVKTENKIDSHPNTTAPAKTPETKNDATPAQPAQPEVKHENKVESQPNTPPAKTPETKNDATPAQPAQPEVKHENKVESQPNTTPPAKTPETKNDANNNQAGRNDANKSEEKNNSNATPSRGTNNPETPKNNDEQK